MSYLVDAITAPLRAPATGSLSLSCSSRAGSPWPLTGSETPEMSDERPVVPAALPADAGQYRRRRHGRYHRCGGSREVDSMSHYRHPDPAVRREMWRRRLAHFRRDPLHRYGWDSLRRERRRERVEQDAAKARTRLLRHVSMLITLVAVALVIVIWDHYAQTVNLPRPADHGVSTGATHPGGQR